MGDFFTVLHWSELIKTDMFSVRMELTPEGEKNISNIVDMFFNYLRLIEEESIDTWRFDEMKKIAEVLIIKICLIPSAKISFSTALLQTRKPYQLSLVHFSILAEFLGEV